MKLFDASQRTRLEANIVTTLQILGIKSNTSAKVFAWSLSQQLDSICYYLEEISVSFQYGFASIFKLLILHFTNQLLLCFNLVQKQYHQTKFLPNFQRRKDGTELISRLSLFSYIFLYFLKPLQSKFQSFLIKFFDLNQKSKTVVTVVLELFCNLVSPYLY